MSGMAVNVDVVSNALTVLKTEGVGGDGYDKSRQVVIAHLVTEVLKDKESLDTSEAKLNAVKAEVLGLVGDNGDTADSLESSVTLPAMRQLSAAILVTNKPAAPLAGSEKNPTRQMKRFRTVVMKNHQRYLIGLTPEDKQHLSQNFHSTFARLVYSNSTKAQQKDIRDLVTKITGGQGEFFNAIEGVLCSLDEIEGWDSSALTGPIENLSKIRAGGAKFRLAGTIQSIRTRVAKSSHWWTRSSTKERAREDANRILKPLLLKQAFHASEGRPKDFIPLPDEALKNLSGDALKVWVNTQPNSESKLYVLRTLAGLSKNLEFGAENPNGDFATLLSEASYCYLGSLGSVGVELVAGQSFKIPNACETRLKLLQSTRKSLGYSKVISDLFDTHIEEEILKNLPVYQALKDPKYLSSNSIAPETARAELMHLRRLLEFKKDPVGANGKAIFPGALQRMVRKYASPYVPNKILSKHAVGRTRGIKLPILGWRIFRQNLIPESVARWNSLRTNEAKELISDTELSVIKLEALLTDLLTAKAWGWKVEEGAELSSSKINLDELTEHCVFLLVRQSSVEAGIKAAKKCRNWAQLIKTDGVDASPHLTEWGLFEDQDGKLASQNSQTVVEAQLAAGNDYD